MITSYYDLLGLPLSASPQAVQKAHLDLSILYDNQRVLTGENLTHLRKNIDEAYRILCDEESRRCYQKQILDFQERQREMEETKRKLAAEFEKFKTRINTQNRTISEQQIALSSAQAKVQILEKKLSPEDAFVISIPKYLVYTTLAIVLIVVVYQLIIYILSLFTG